VIDFYYNLAPNPRKIALFLEESGLPYRPVPVDTRKGEQHTPAFRALNPNDKVPVIVDEDGTVVFDSNAILLYLSDKHGLFGGAPGQRGALLSWLMFIATGVGPYNGQAVHFQTAAPEFPYAINRYRREAQRHFAILDERLANRPFLLGESYSIADIALWGWTIPFDRVMGGSKTLADYPHVKRWFETVSARPAAARALALGADHPWKTEMDEDARRAMFPSNY
jgi:GST-like protein